MARHSLGRWLNEADASLRTIMDTLGHAGIHSSARYQSTDIEVTQRSGRFVLPPLPARKRNQSTPAAATFAL